MEELKIQNICSHFISIGDITEIREHRVGHIHDTFVIRTNQEKDYLLQKINTYVFHDPKQVMMNIQYVTAHLQTKGISTLALIKTTEGSLYYCDGEDFWRMYEYIPSVTYSHTDDLSLIWEEGSAFGLFASASSDMNMDHMKETIPDFHNTPKYVDKLLKHVKEDPLGRCKEIEKELAVICEKQEEAGCLQRKRMQGELPLRIVHNDTKINNVLFDEANGKALAVVDLDTVMPGLLAYDFGDGVRSCANRIQEAGKDYENAVCDVKRFTAFLNGYLSGIKGILTVEEWESFAIAPFVLTFETAVRYFDDYIMGDPYYHIEYPDQNLDRARCQLHLAMDLYEKASLFRKTLSLYF